MYDNFDLESLTMMWPRVRMGIDVLKTRANPVYPDTTKVPPCMVARLRPGQVEDKRTDTGKGDRVACIIEPSEGLLLVE